MKRSPASLANRFAWRYCKSGEEGKYTKVFSNFDGEVQTSLLHQARLGAEEVPAIAFYTDDANWVLLTSHRLLSAQDSTRRQSDLTEIENVTVKFSDTPDARGKKDLKRLNVVTKQGNMQLELESGAPFSGFWNVLKMIAGMNHSIGEELPSI